MKDEKFEKLVGQFDGFLRGWEKEYNKKKPKNKKPFKPRIDDVAQHCTLEEISEMLKQLDVGVDVSSDSDKDLISQKVISIEEAPLDVEMYCISELENGDTIFVNDILVGVWRD